MKLKEAAKAVSDVPSIFPKVKRSEIVPKKILCSHGDFCAMELADGRYAAMWTAHLDVADNMESLLELLNQHERVLLSLKHGYDEGKE